MQHTQTTPAKTIAASLIISAAALLSATPALAQKAGKAAGKAASTQRTCRGEVRFAPGSYTGTVSSVVRGYNYCEYRIRARAGQTLSAQLTGSPSLQAILYGEESIDLSDGQDYTLPRNGTYTVRVLQTRNSARSSKAAQAFSLAITIR